MIQSAMGTRFRSWQVFMSKARFFIPQILAQLNTDETKDLFTIRKDFFLNKETESKLHVVNNASTSNLGIQSSGAVFDEIGAYKDDSNLQTIQSGMSLSEQKPLLLMASNPPEIAEHFVYSIDKSL